MGVLSKKPISKVTPLKSVQEVNVQEVVQKTEVPEDVAREFLKWRDEQNAKPEGRAANDDYDEEVPAEYDGKELKNINNEIKVIDKELVKKLEEIKNLEEVVSQLKVKKLEEVKKIQEVTNKEP